jgi:hypothetical protein
MKQLSNGWERKEGEKQLRNVTVVRNICDKRKLCKV